MPYSKLDDLPDPVQDNLPKEAQKIYKEAFNSAYQQYDDHDDRDKVASKVAWSAVKKKYHKEGGDWVRD